MKWGRRLRAGVEKTKSTTADGTRNDEKIAEISSIFRPGIMANTGISFKGSAGVAMAHKRAGVTHIKSWLMSPNSSLR